MNVLEKTAYVIEAGIAWLRAVPVLTACLMHRIFHTERTGRWVRNAGMSYESWVKRLGESTPEFESNMRTVYSGSFIYN